MRLSVHYNTVYHYSEPTQRVIQLLRLTPVSFAGQNVLDWRIDVDCDARLREGRDGYGNITHMLYIDRPVQALRVSVTGKPCPAPAADGRGLDRMLAACHPGRRRRSGTGARSSSHLPEIAKRLSGSRARSRAMS